MLTTRERNERAANTLPEFGRPGFLAEQFGVGEDTVRRMLDDGRLTRYGVPGARLVLVRTAELRALIEATAERGG